MRTLLIGIDAACRPVLDRLVSNGDVPALASLFDAGTTGDLTSQVPPWTPSAWPSLYTGVNPGKHGVFGFLTFDGYDWDVVNATDVREDALWEVLGAADRRSVVVNAPVTHPPPSIDGAVVPGYVGPEDPACHPPGLLADLRSALGEYRVYADQDGSGDDRDARVEEYRTLTNMRGRAFRHLAGRFEPEFGFVQFQQTDTVFHECPDDWAAVRAVYRAVDDEVGAILDAHDPETVVVASDHGIGEYDGWEFRVNDFLREAGYVETHQGESGMPSWGVAGRERQRGGEEATPGLPKRALALSKRSLESTLSAGARAGLTAQRIGAALDRVGLRDAVLAVAPMDLVAAASESVDFRRSRAYMRSRIECGVRINLAGREPDGVVPPDEYERVRDELVGRLRGVETPAGDPVFETVAPREAFFDGPYVAEAPDVITVPRAFDHYLSAGIRDEAFVAEPRESWNHKRDGFVALAGDAVDETADLGDAHLFDVAPTVLASLDVPARSSMDGSALPGVESAGRVAASDDQGSAEPATERRRTRTDDEAVEARLSDMGYLE